MAKLRIEVPCEGCLTFTPVEIKKPSYFTETTFKFTCRGCATRFLVLAHKLKADRTRVKLETAPLDISDAYMEAIYKRAAEKRHEEAANEQKETP